MRRSTISYLFHCQRNSKKTDANRLAGAFASIKSRRDDQEVRRGEGRQVRRNRDIAAEDRAEAAHSSAAAAEAERNIAAAGAERSSAAADSKAAAADSNRVAAADSGTLRQ